MAQAVQSEQFPDFFLRYVPCCDEFICHIKDMTDSMSHIFDICGRSS